MSAENKHKWKKRICGSSCLLGIIAGGLIGLSELIMWNWRKEHQAQFGTIKQPAYSITTTFQESDDFRRIENYYAVSEDVVADERDIIAQLDELYEQGLSTFNSVNEAFQQINTLPEAQQTSRLCGLLRACRTTEVRSQLFSLDYHYTRARLQRNINSIEDLLSGQASVDFDPHQISMQLFQQLTGKSFPENVHFVHEQQRQNIGGYHRFSDGVISSKGIQNLEELMVLLHEEGHAIAQQGEQNARGLTMLFTTINSDLKVLEEACAYAFVDAGARILADENISTTLKFYFEAYISRFAQKYYENDPVAENEHYPAAALFLATREVYNDPARTFNQLATADSLSSLPPEILEEMNAANERHNLHISFPNELDERIARIETVLDQYELLHTQVQERLDTLNEESRRNNSRAH
ncbi:MAG: hypothetical protein HY363_06320 [Candidatus Aenigmarchaeota archaeon]|nr:hypothetical protein [Candidatus Aenigmarchaeota archaeon]